MRQFPFESMWQGMPAARAEMQQGSAKFPRCLCSGLSSALVSDDYGFAHQADFTVYLEHAPETAKSIQLGKRVTVTMLESGDKATFRVTGKRLQAGVLGVTVEGVER